MLKKYSEPLGYGNNPFQSWDRIVKITYGWDIRKLNTDYYSTVYSTTLHIHVSVNKKYIW